MPEAASLELARRRVKRAAGLLREAAADLAGALHGEQVVAVVTVDDTDDIDDVVAGVQLGLHRHGGHPLDVVILTREQRAGTPTTAPAPGAKETEHHEQHRNSA